jgi:dephospho-CoA kinase
LQNQTDRLWLENLLHPLIREQITIEYAKCKSPYCIIEIPLLTNKSDYPYLNSVILVKSTQEQQIKRIIERDNVSQTEAEAILATTNLHEEKRLAIADHILINDGSIEDLKHQITLLHQELVSDPSHRASGL